MTILLGRRHMLFGVGAALVPLPSIAADLAPIIGAGSSFASRAVAGWIEGLGAAKRISYDPVGSGNGRTRVLAGEVDFALSDEPMTAEQLRNGGLIQIPVVFGGIAPVVNLPGVETERLVLTSELIAAIYVGAIRTWNDPRIAAVNPGMKLPELDVRPVHQATPNGPPSGTTFTFTQYLLATTSDWRAKHGTAITKRWAVGSMVATATFMAETVKVMSGALGYTSFGDAAGHGLATVRLVNKAGKPTAARVDGLQSAVAQVNWSSPGAMEPSLLDLSGEATWPIVTATYALVPQAPADRAKAESVRDFMSYVVSSGQPGAERARAAALPASARDPALLRLRQAAG